MKRLAQALCLAAGIALLALVLRGVETGAVASAAAAFAFFGMPCGVHRRRPVEHAADGPEGGPSPPPAHEARPWCAICRSLYAR